MRKIILSHRLGETRAVVVAGSQVEAIRFAREDSPRLVGNIYKGRVKNFLPGMQAAFVDIGREKNSFLQFNAKKKFSVGQSVLIQIDKDETGAKGARSTLNISLAGRLAIYLPTLGYVGVSNKIRGEARERLHALAKKIRPKNAGIIIRTAAEECSEEELIDDFNALVELWNEIEIRCAKCKPPALLYDANDLLEKILRDFGADSEFVTDNLKIFRRLKDLVDEKQIDFYEGTAPIFEAFGVNEELEKINRRELDLPSGGRIVIDKTEALTAVDVNTGKFIGDTNLDETVLKTNLEAAELILKQLRLRDLGGIIIVDFIDMNSEAHKKILMDCLRELAALDSSKTKIIDMTPLGLVEITRQG
ncbi:MAG: Rne/Rng family ribonuclease [Selenomonadaceae bacterium]|nr:Rne/Rng family ribonuclease [Selenomonadaceae bacterium]